jgi:hypothetical protein
MYGVRWGTEEPISHKVEDWSYADVATLGEARELSHILSNAGYVSEWWPLEATRTHARNHITRFGGPVR